MSLFATFFAERVDASSRRRGVFGCLVWNGESCLLDNAVVRCTPPSSLYLTATLAESRVATVVKPEALGLRGLLAATAERAVVFSIRDRSSESSCLTAGISFIDSAVQW